MKWHPELYFTWGDSSIRRICLAKMSIRPKRTQFCWKMLCFQQLTQLNLVIAVENTPTRASAFNLSDPAVVVNERAVTSRHRNEEYSSNPHFVSGSNTRASCRVHLVRRAVWVFPSSGLAIHHGFLAVSGWLCFKPPQSCGHIITVIIIITIIIITPPCSCSSSPSRWHPL